MSERRLEAWGETNTGTEPIRLRLMPDSDCDGGLVLRMVDGGGVGVQGGNLLRFCIVRGKLHIYAIGGVGGALPVNTDCGWVVVE